MFWPWSSLSSDQKAFKLQKVHRIKRFPRYSHLHSRSLVIQRNVLKLLTSHQTTHFAAPLFSQSCVHRVQTLSTETDKTSDTERYFSCTRFLWTLLNTLRIQRLLYVPPDVTLKKGAYFPVVSGQVLIGNVSWMLFPGMDGVRTFRSKTGSWAGSTHLQIIRTSRVWSSNFIPTLSSPFSVVLQTPTNSSTQQQLSIQSCTHGPRDKHSARPCHVNVLSKVRV
jgi:hypothetical protein